jgi:hypothetical protein
MSKGEWNKKWWDASEWNKKWWDASVKWICVHWCQRGSEIRSDEISAYTWTLGLKTLHFNSSALHLSCMCASGNHVLYFIYELYHALELMVL